jgi:hypothetical protein
MGANVCETRASVWIMKRSHVLKVHAQRLLNVRVLLKVDRFDLASITAFVHHLRLASNSLVLIATHRHQDDLMEPGPRILQQLQHGFLAGRNLWAIQQSIDDLMHSFAHISEFFA